MNVERLNAVALAVLEDFSKSDPLALLEELDRVLQLAVGQPQDGEHQKAVRDRRQQTTEALTAARVNEFPSIWKQVLEEIGIDNVLGIALRDRVEEIFGRNEITLAAAQDEISELATEVEAVKETLEQLTVALKALKIGSEVLSPGECEFVVLIPRSVVEGELESLGKEFEKLQTLLEPFAELAGESRPQFKVKTISSSDFGVYIELLPRIAAAVAQAIERIVALYKSLLEIRVHQKALKEKGLTKAELKGIEDHANKHMDKGIQSLVDELMQQYASDVEAGRQNELKAELKFTLNGIARRIDFGYSLDVRAEPPTDIDVNEEKGAQAKAAFDSIKKASPNLKFLSLSGEPILSLPQSADEVETSKIKARTRPGRAKRTAKSAGSSRAPAKQSPDSAE